ncbi:MAG: hypothetical protein WCF60_09055 [Anaerobacillus sp.]
MSWCNHCNREEAGAFCVKCGRMVVRKAPVKKTRWLFWGTIAGAVLIVLVSSFITLRWLASPERTVDRFREALRQEDYKTLAELVPEVNPFLSHDSEIESFATLLRNHPEQRALLLRDLERQATSLADRKLVNRDKNLVIPMELIEKEKAFFVFKHYVISPSQVYVEVYTQFPKTTLFINKEKGGKIADKGKEIGPFLPGDYHFETELINESYTMRGEADVEVVGSEETLQVELPVNGTFVIPESNYGDAVLFINGKDTGLTVGDSDELGPFPTDGSVVMHAEKTFEAGVVKSPSVSIEGEEVSLVIDYSEPAPVVIEKEVDAEAQATSLNPDQTEPIIRAVNTYLNDWIDAYEHLDTGYFTNLTPELVSYFEDRFISVKQNNGAFTGEIVEAAFDMDSFSIDSSGKRAEVDVLVTMDSADHEPGDQNVDTEVTSSGFHYNLVKSGGTWLIDSREPVDHVDVTNAVLY